MSAQRQVDISEDGRIEKFFNEGCSCKQNCYLKFTKDEARQIRNDLLELEDKERDMLIMGFLFTQKPKTGDKIQFSIRGVHVCRKTFLFLYAVSKTLYSAVCKHFDENGPIPRVHGNSKKLPHNVIDLVSTERARNFIENYALANAQPLPGRVPSYRDSDAKLLLIPSFETKESVYKKYKELCNDNNFDFLGLSSFGHLWKTQLPNVLITKPMGDLCWVCQQGNERLLRSHLNNNEDDEDDHEEAQDEQTAHIVEATQEARYYRAQVF